MRYFGVNKRVAVERKDYVGPTKKRDLEKVVEYVAASKRLSGDHREIDYAIKTIEDRFKSIGEVEVYSVLGMFGYVIMVKGKKKYLKQVFEDIL